MPSDEDRELVAQLEQANAHLKDSLRRCRALVAQCRAKLAQRTGEAAKPMFGWRGTEANENQPADDERMDSQA